MRRIHPDQRAGLADADLLSAYAFPERGPWVRGSMVSTLDGAMRGADGTSRSISTAADRRVFSALRLTCDVVLVGAGTVRDERYGPSKRPIAIVTSSLDLPLSLPLFSEQRASAPRTIVLTTEQAAATAPSGLRGVADIVECGEAHVDLRTALDQLSDRGLDHIHCEGGPRLLGALAAADLLDELLLTLTPLMLGAAPGGHVIALAGGLQPLQRLHVTQVLEEDGSVFIRASRP